MYTMLNFKKSCCGCSACMNICPEHAISMKPDEDGFAFPQINVDLCIKCGLCDNVCALKNESVVNNEPIAVYAAINKNESTLMSSASGGVFGALANIVLGKNGIIFGCAYNERMEPEHVGIKSKSDIKKLQGSKYVQSDINTTFTEAREYLKKGKWVLFTGTPCQIAALKLYLGKDYDQLITADIICHGVPSKDFFKGYIKYLEEKLKGKVVDFKFRDKTKGWGLTGKVVYQKNDKIYERSILPIDSYYYYYFLRGEIYRASCYECKYACGNREGDFTMGDYWGIGKVHPEVQTEKGVSLLLVNSKKGMTLIDELRNYLELTESNFDQARVYNEQLNRPMDKSSRRGAILKMWREGGYKAIADDYYKSNKKMIMMARIKKYVPVSIKESLKAIINRR